MMYSTIAFILLALASVVLSVEALFMRKRIRKLERHMRFVWESSKSRNRLSFEKPVTRREVSFDVEK
jgi:hypothetical protein